MTQLAIQTQVTLVSGGYETSRPDLPVQGMWSEHEQKKSSFWRGAQGTLVHSTQPPSRSQQQSRFVVCRQQGCGSILRIGSRKRTLHRLALDILDTCQELNCTLHPQWIPREQNLLADELINCYFLGAQTRTAGASYRIISTHWTNCGDHTLLIDLLQVQTPSVPGSIQSLRI